MNGAHSRTGCSHFFVCLFAQFSPLSLVQRIFDAMILIAFSQICFLNRHYCHFHYYYYHSYDCQRDVSDE